MLPSPNDDLPTLLQSSLSDDLPTRLQSSLSDDLPTRLPDSQIHMSGSDEGGVLPVGTRLAEFEIQDKIGEGGFSTVYRAWDHVLRRQVALKEYFPSSIASRSGQTQVCARSQRHQDTFSAGLDSFIKEAQTLAGFDHPALVKVLRFFPANGTAYMVMPLYVGITFRDAVRTMHEPPSEAWLLAQLDPLTKALQSIHAQGWFHRDIAPDNIMLIEGGSRPLLLDFGAARRVIGDLTQALTVILKPGYAPVEQYAEVPGMKQGAWTDVYALAATVHWAITGKTPPTAVGRMVNDTLQPLTKSAAGRYSPRFLAALDDALKVRPSERTSDMTQFRTMLGLNDGMVSPNPSDASPSSLTIKSLRTKTGSNTSILPKQSLMMSIAVGSLLVAGSAWLWLQEKHPADAKYAPAQAPLTPTPPPIVATERLESGNAPPLLQVPPTAAATVAPNIPTSSPSTLARPTVELQPTESKPTIVPPVAPKHASSTVPVAGPNSRPAVSRAEALPATPRDTAVCANLMQRLSLGEDLSILREQLAANRCQ